jgi:membrane-associated protease RseP (regulator of RpoE activity)
MLMRGLKMSAKSMIESLPILGIVLVIAGLTQMRPTVAQQPVPVPPVPVPVTPSPVQPSPVPSRGSLGFSGTVIPGLGLRVNYVYPFSSAQRIQLEPGDVILMVNGVRIDSMIVYDQVLDSSGGFVNLVIRNVRTRAPVMIPRVPLEPPAFDALPNRPTRSTEASSDKPRGRAGLFIQSR